MHADLSFEQAPNISVPFRFLLTAPWFGVAAGLLAAVAGEQAIATRWSPTALALTHLLAVGFILQAMIGALLQFVPVAAGGNVWRPGWVAGFVHPAATIAALTLAAAFLTGATELLRISALIFAVAIGVLVAVVGTALLRTPAKGATIRALRLAVAGLSITVLLGATLAEGLAGGRSWPLADVANVHAAWGLGAWSLTLLAGVSYFVVPMFQLTPPYPERYARLMPAALLVVTAVWSAQLAISVWISTVWLLGLFLAAVHGGVTLMLQHRRRRRVTDPTFWFFRGAMLSLVVIFLSALLFVVEPSIGESPKTAWWFGVLALPGVFVSAINGMAYKIVPFLNWLHLQRLMGLGGLPPNMKEMISERSMWWQTRLHFVAVALLLAATFWPGLVGAGGLAFSASCGWLGVNLGRAANVYRRVRDRIGVAAPDRAP